MNQECQGRMTDPARTLAEKVMKTGFSCLRCGACCEEHEPGSNLVMVTPLEIRAIMKVTGLSWDELVEPFPEVLERGEDGARYTFEWVLRRNGGRCAFHSDGSCRIYPCRPWICRTYPFWLISGSLGVFPCPGTGALMEEKDAMGMAINLLERQNAEIAEEHMVKEVLESHTLPTGGLAVIDSEGIRVIHE